VSYQAKERLRPKRDRSDLEIPYTTDWKYR
jgi:hypothetical protein